MPVAEPAAALWGHPIALVLARKAELQMQRKKVRRIYVAVSIYLDHPIPSHPTHHVVMRAISSTYIDLGTSYIYISAVVHDYNIKSIQHTAYNIFEYNIQHTTYSTQHTTYTIRVRMR